MKNTIFEKKFLTIHKSYYGSYHDNFKVLNKKDLESLCDHTVLLEKVNNELKDSVSKADLNTFELNLEVIQNNGNGFNNLYATVYNKDSLVHQNYIESCLFEKPKISKESVCGIYTKLANKSSEVGNSWVSVKDCMYETDAVRHLANGFSVKKITLYDRFSEAVNVIAAYVDGIWTNLDLTVILNMCKTNEKFVFLLLYPYFIVPLKKVLWPTLLPVFHFVSGSFTKLIQEVSNLLVEGTFLNHTFRTLKFKTSTKFVFFGVSGSLGLYTCLNHIFKSGTKQALIPDKMYKGLSGTLGSGVSLLRIEGSKYIYELAKTVSTFTSAAIAGALEPKQEIISKILKDKEVSNLWKNIKK